MINDQQIIEFLQNNIAVFLERELTQLAENFSANQQPIIAQMAENLGDLICSAQKLELSESKGIPAYLTISFLRTNILFDIWKYRLDIYDEKFILDKIACTGELEASFIFTHLKNILDNLPEIIKKSIYVNKLRPYHLNFVKIETAEALHLAAIVLFKTIIKEVMVLVENNCAGEIPNLKIMMGEYLDKAVIIYEGGE